MPTIAIWSFQSAFLSSRSCCHTRFNKSSLPFASSKIWCSSFWNSDEIFFVMFSIRCDESAESETRIFLLSLSTSFARCRASLVKLQYRFFTLFGLRNLQFKFNELFTRSVYHTCPSRTQTLSCIVLLICYLISTEFKWKLFRRQRNRKYYIQTVVMRAPLKAALASWAPSINNIIIIINPVLPLP